MGQNDEVRTLVQLRTTLQKARIQFGNRVSAIESGRSQDNGRRKNTFDKYTNVFQELEDLVTEDIRAYADEMPFVEYVTDVKGVGKLYAASLLSQIDIYEADTVSALHRYCGYAVIDGERERPRKGEKLHYNAKLKTLCYNIGSSMLKANSPYRKVYDEAKEYYESNRPDWTKAHRHQAAMRKMIKRFLSHLWLEWRAFENLPITEPYVQEKLGHTHIDKPQDYGWREIVPVSSMTAAIK